MDQHFTNGEELSGDCSKWKRKTQTSKTIYPNQDRIQHLEADRTGPLLSDGAFAKRASCKAAAALLCLLCCLLLIALLTLAVHFTRASSQWEMERLVLNNSFTNVTAELGRLQTRYDNLTEVRDQLQEQFDKMSVEKNNLQAQIQEFQQGWVYFRGSLYYISPTEKSWHESRESCLRMGADLMIINSREKQGFASGLEEHVWIGLTDADTEGKWKWVDETPLTESYWGPGEPNGFQQREEDCVELKKYDLKFSWNDLSCDLLNRWICEKKPTPFVG